MFKTGTAISFINFLSTKFPKFKRGKDLFNLHPVSLTAANRKKFIASDSVRQTGSRAIFAILLFCFAFNYANAQNVNVAGAFSGNGSYGTLSAAFNAINGGFQGGTNISITITGNTTEPATGAVLFEGLWNSLSIQPSGGFRTVSGTMNPGVPLIDLNGADRVTIDGSFSLELSNLTISPVTNTSTIRFSSDAVNNTITACRIFGSSTTALATRGGTILFSVGFSTGNDNNIISFCDIGSSSGLPTKAVHFAGNPSLANSSNTIMNCNIFDYFRATAPSAGVYVSDGTTDITIKDNRFYQTASRTQTTGSVHYSIGINYPSGNNYLVSGNTIGFASFNGTGTYTFTGTTNSFFEAILLNVGTTTATSVQGNTIAGISMSGSQSGNFSGAPLKGINVIYGLVNIGNITPNTIGNITSTGSITYISSTASASAVIAISLGGISNITVSNNNIGGITASNTASAPANIWGIRSTTIGTLTCQNNIIGGTVTNSIQSTSTSTSTIVNGIENSGRAATISANTIGNITSASGTALSGYTVPIAGITVMVIEPSFNQTISQNTIHTINNTDNSNSTVVAGIYLLSTSVTNLIERNFVHSLNSNSTSGSITGIYANGDKGDFQNNMIRLGIDGSGNSVSSCLIRGINEENGTNNFYFNSVYVGGTASSGSSNTFAFNSTNPANTRRYVNNIFFNARSNGGGTGKHYAISAGGTSPLPTGLISNYNLLHVTGTGSVLGLFNSTDQPNLAAWKTATGKDTNSISTDPVFANPTGNSSSVNLHVGGMTPVESAGTLIGSVTNDFDGQTRSTLTPTDIGADAGDFTNLLGPIISYTLLSSGGLNTVSFNNVIITDTNGVNGTSGTRPRCYFKKKTNTNAFNDNTNSTNGWKYVEAAGSVSPFNFIINHSLIFGGVAPGDSINYFVIAQDLFSTPNIGINSGFFASAPSSVNLTSSAFPISGNINSYIVGTVVVAGALTGNGGYPTLASAFSAINSSAQTGANISILIYGNVFEPVTGAVLNSGAWTSLTISPSGGEARTVTCPITPGYSLIELNGADNVTIDGLNTGGNSLVLSNTQASSIAGTSTISLWNDASKNVITRCTILGSSRVDINTPGGVVNVSAGASTGNDSNVISYCDIGQSPSFDPTKCISFIGSPDNNGNTVHNCNINDYFAAPGNSAGIYAGSGNSGLSIRSNRFYQTTPQVQALGPSQHSAIWIINPSGNNFTVTGNIIGYASSTGTGTYSLTNVVAGTRFIPIHLGVGTTTASRVDGNTIAGISISGTSSGIGVNAPFTGILVTAGLVNIGVDSGNVIGNPTTNGSINFTTFIAATAEVAGIHIENPALCTIKNNVIGGITSSNTNPGKGNIMNMFGIRNQSSGNSVCQNNIVGGTAANSIQTLSYNEANVLVGIQQIGGSSTVVGNSVRNMTAVSGYPNGIFINTGNYSHTVSQNTVYAISSTNVSNSTFVRGMYVASSGSNNIERNLIHSLSASSANLTINGIEVQAGTSTIKNNMIRLGLDTSGNSMNTGCKINGMYETGGTNNFYFNSVYIGGTVPAGSANSYAFQSLVTNNTRNFLNNIFYNARTNNSPGVKHYAIRAGGTGVNPPGLNCNYNILFAPNIGGMIGFYNSVDYSNLTGWRTATGQDNNSHATDPEFINETGSASSFDLHINNTPTPVEQKGISIGSVTDDFDGETRSLLTPTDIGADAGNFVNSDPLAGDYTVGTALFNSVTGKNIRFERVVRKVMKEVDGSFETTTEVEGKLVSAQEPGKVVKEIEEISFVPMEKGSPYNGPLYVKRSEYPNLPQDAMMGVYATLTAAINDLNARGASAPVRFLLLDSAYASETLPMVITAWQGASANNTLTIKPNTGVTSTISGSNSTAVFDINTGDYFILDGSNTDNGSSKDLTVANSSTLGSTIRFINDARNNTVKNCILKGSSTSGINGVVFFSTTSGPSGNDSNLVQNNDITKDSGFPTICVYNNGTGTTSAAKNSNNRITGNRLFDFRLRGFYDEGNSAGTLYEANEIYTVSVSNGFQVGFRVVGSNIEGFTFRNNYIHDLKTSATTLIYGIELTQIQDSFTGEIYNNFISLSEVNSNDIRGIVDASPAGNSYNIYYNSVNITGTVTGTKNSDAYHRLNANNTNFKNNILVNTRTGGTGKHYAIRTISPLTNFNCNYNDIYAGGGTGNVFGRLDATDRINLADWKVATGKDSNSVSGNPLFVSNANLHIDSIGSSPVSNAGTPISGIPTDIDNNIRSLTTPDIGADEFEFTVPSITMNLKMLIEGFYSAASNLQVIDTVKIYLRNSGSPYALIDSAEAVVSDSGIASLTFSNTATGSYYIVLTHRNSIETWSASEVAMTKGITVNYDFTNASSQAFDNNMKQVDNSPAIFAIYSGDVNQNGAVDLADITDVYNSSAAFVTGYVVTDVDGNNSVDLSDITLSYNNSVNFVSVRRP